jgi:hypothetical protein
MKISMKNAASISDSGLEIVTSKKEIQYEGWVEKNLRTSPVTLMIGWEEKRDPFYPPESIALVIAGLLTQWCQSIDICTYRSPALTFNNIDPATYYDEAEQQNHIIECLRNLGVTEDAMKCMTFVSPDEDKEVKTILQGFDAYPESDHPMVARLEELYEKNESFRNQVDKAVLASFRGKPRAYKYTLFELAMILMRKPAIKAGDIREKKYDEIVRRFREELWWELSEGEKKGQQPFQVIYWHRDNAREKYHWYLHEKHHAEIAKKEHTIVSLKKYFQNTVAAALMFAWLSSWLTYSIVRMRSWQDNIYRMLIEQSQKQFELYDAYYLELKKLTDFSWYSSVIVSENKFLCHDIVFQNGQWLTTDVHTKVQQRRKTLIDTYTQKLAEAAKEGRNFHDAEKLRMFQDMVKKIVTTYIDRRIFRSENKFYETLVTSDAYRLACEFLDTSLVASLGE